MSPKGVPKLWALGNVGPVRVSGDRPKVPKLFYLGTKMRKLYLLLYFYLWFEKCWDSVQNGVKPMKLNNFFRPKTFGTALGRWDAAEWRAKA